ncbi:MAG: family 10 glycosylhydrolase [Verrucomicrobiales bacterium]|nr:family 10 glycosylhydrolase [Verrucomicrobiales bacterium]
MSPAPFLCSDGPLIVSPERARSTKRPGFLASLRGLLALVLATGAAVMATAAEGELRGLWVDGFHAGFRNPTEVTQLVATARAGGFNTLLVEVRRRGDAFYSSDLEPRAAEVEAGFDPLRTLLDCAHAESGGPRLGVHAWLVAFNIWNHETRRPPQTNHPYLRHPDWLTRTRSGRTWDGANYAFDPGHPAVQEHTFQVGMELVRRYDIDGLHLDYIRYAGPEWGYHPLAVARFNRAYDRSGTPPPTDAAWRQFRRDQVSALVRRIYLHAHAEKPDLIVSAATIAFAPGIRERLQWSSSAAYAHVLQDWRAWMEEGILDWNLPMLYFREAADGASLTDWLRFVSTHQYRRRAAAGLGFYLNSFAATEAQIERARACASDDSPGLIGFCAYSYANLATDLPHSNAVERLERLVRPGEQAGPPANVVPTPAQPASTLSGTGHLMGYVRQSGNLEPIEGAELLLVAGDALLLATDANGFFGRVDLEPGNYPLTVSAPGYSDQATSVVVRGDRSVARLDLVLKRSEVVAGPPESPPAKSE